MRIGLSLTSLAVALTLAGGVPTAQAGDEGWAAFGGFLGGTLLANLHHGHTVRAPVVYESRVFVDPAPVMVRHVRHAPRYVKQRVWNEGYWEVHRDRCGRRVKSWVPGYYTVERVRVEYRSPVRHPRNYRYRSYGSYRTSCGRW